MICTMAFSQPSLSIEMRDYSLRSSGSPNGFLKSNGRLQAEISEVFQESSV